MDDLEKYFHEIERKSINDVGSALEYVGHFKEGVGKKLYSPSVTR